MEIRRSARRDIAILVFILAFTAVGGALLRPRASRQCDTLTSLAWAQASSCGNAIIEPPEECDPPGSITCPPGSPAMAFLPCTGNCTCPTVTTTTIIGTTTTTLPLHFLCWEIHQPKQTQPVTLTDQFGSGTAEVRQAKRLCTPADKNNETQNGRTAPDHLTAFKIRAPKVTVPDVLVTDQFGSLTMRISKPEVLLVPTAKALGTVPPAPLAAPLDHYKCYRVKGAKFKLSGITIDDQFGTHIANIKKPYRLCNPVDKNGGGIQDPVNHLLCYKIRNGSSPIPGMVSTDNQFGQATYPLKGSREFCVPALKTLLVTTTSISVTTTSSTIPPVCGNGTVEGAEQCDPPTTPAGSAQCPGSPAGAFPCRADCTCCPQPAPTCSPSGAFLEE